MPLAIIITYLQCFILVVIDPFFNWLLFVEFLKKNFASTTATFCSSLPTSCTETTTNTLYKTLYSCKILVFLVTLCQFFYVPCYLNLSRNDFNWLYGPTPLWTTEHVLPIIRTVSQFFHVPCYLNLSLITWRRFKLMMIEKLETGNISL